VLDFDDETQQKRPLPYKEIALKACSACEDANHKESYAHCVSRRTGIGNAPVAQSIQYRHANGM